jgi:hypothetical protein
MNDELKSFFLSFIIHHFAFILAFNPEPSVYSRWCGKSRARLGPDSSLTSGARDKLLSGCSTSKIKAILFSRKNHWTRLALPQSAV